ncbi:MAG TPA: hypothetical protein PKD27_12940 [Tepidiformaceae bacterium]|nr:hypothetical protein [Tepidiformaceae bacterium]
MDIERARYLVSPQGRESLTSLAHETDLDPNRLATRLRRQFPPAEAAALAEQLTLRARAASRFEPGEGLTLYSAAGIEMMTHPIVARSRAERLAALGLPVVDLTCGIGGDLSAVARNVPLAIGLERDPSTALLAAANVPGAHVLGGDATAPPVRLEEFAAIIDPARRGAAGRRFDPEAFEPSWDACVSLLRSAGAGVLKAPPGLQHERVPSFAELEAVQLGRDLRELALWSGASAEPGLRRAVLLPAALELTSNQPASQGLTPAVGRYVFDPESCVTRATLVQQLAFLLTANFMDARVAYLTSDTAAFHPMAATFEVIDVVPFSLQRLKEYLRAHSLRPDEIRRRAFPVEPDELRRLLGKLPGERVTLLCTTLNAERITIVARRVYAPAPEAA